MKVAHRFQFESNSGDSYPQGANSWAQVQSVYYSDHEAVAYSNPLCLAEVRALSLMSISAHHVFQFGGGFLLSWGEVAKGGTGYEKYSQYMLSKCQN